MNLPITRTLILGTRPSRLARWQTDHVVDLLKAAWPGLDCRVIPLTTQGDRILDRSLPEIGGKGVFTAELEQALHAQTIDLAVHSLKDLPVESPAGLETGAVCARQDVRDALVSAHGWTLDDLPAGSRVGTSSLRRSAQLLARRPDLQTVSIRGNVDTRLRKVLQGEPVDGKDKAGGDLLTGGTGYAAIVLAAAGLARLGLEARITQYLPLHIMLPAPGQGALAVQCRADDNVVLDLLARIDEPSTRAATTAERTFLKALGGGCSAPIAAYAEAQDGSPPKGSRSPSSDPGEVSSGDRTLFLQGLVASLDGRTVLRASGRGLDAEALGRQAAEEVLAQGAARLISMEG
jgi:hydroxymethylbilane synthase